MPIKYVHSLLLPLYKSSRYGATLALKETDPNSEHLKNLKRWCPKSKNPTSKQQEASKKAGDKTGVVQEQKLI